MYVNKYVQNYPQKLWLDGNLGTSMYKHDKILNFKWP